MATRSWRTNGNAAARGRFTGTLPGGVRASDLIGRQVGSPYAVGVIFERTSVDHRVMVVCRASVARESPTSAMVAELGAWRMDFSHLHTDDVRDALRYAAEAVDERELPLQTTG